MIGLLNVPCDSPIDFYASAPNKSTAIKAQGDGSGGGGGVSGPLLCHAAAQSKPQLLASNVVPPSLLNLECEDENSEPLFMRRRMKKKLSYLPDGRRMLNGKPIETTNTGKMWEQLLVRSFVHKIEEEIPSPVERLSLVQEQLPQLSTANELAGTPGHRRSQSTYSLVSDGMVMDRCEKCNERKSRRSSMRQAEAPARSPVFSFSSVNLVLTGPCEVIFGP